jgi:hypothetical protein
VENWLRQFSTFTPTHTEQSAHFVLYSNQQTKPASQEKAAWPI